MVFLMKLKHVHIDSYKLFRDFDIDFCVDSRINGNGKSTLLKYLLPKNFSTNHAGTVSVLTDSGTETFHVPPTLGEYKQYKQAFDCISYFGTEDATRASGQLQREVLRYVDRFVYVEGKTSFEAYREIQKLIDDVFADFHLNSWFLSMETGRPLVWMACLMEKNRCWLKCSRCLQPI